MKRIIVPMILLCGCCFGDGGPGSLSPYLIAHYKMDEDTASDNDELVTNGDFAAWDSIGGRTEDPTGWTVTGEVTTDPEVSEVGTGEGHGGAGTGMCNIYSSDGTPIYIAQTVSGFVVGRKYRVSVNIDTATTGSIRIRDYGTDQWAGEIYSTTGIKTLTFVATQTTVVLRIDELGSGTDVTIDDVSIQLLAVEDSSGNDHDGLLQQDTDAIHVAGKIDGAFDFDGTSDYILIPDHDDFSPGDTTPGSGTPFSISAWVYMHTARYFVWASKWQVGSNQEWNIFTGTPKEIHFRMYDQNAGAYIGRTYNTSLASYEGKWTHFVATYDGGTLSSGCKIYLNGNRVDDTDSKSGTFISVENHSQPVWIGRYSDKYSDGLIDDVMFFSRELSQAEVDYLYIGTGKGYRRRWLDGYRRQYRSRYKF